MSIVVRDTSCLLPGLVAVLPSCRGGGYTDSGDTTWQPYTAYGWAGAGWSTMPTDWNPAQDAEKALSATIDEVFGQQRPPGLQLTVREGNSAQILLEPAPAPGCSSSAAADTAGSLACCSARSAPPAPNTQPARCSRCTATRPRPPSPPSKPLLDAAHTSDHRYSGITKNTRPLRLARHERLYALPTVAELSTGWASMALAAG